MRSDDPKTLREVAQRASDRNDGARGRELGRKASKLGLSLSYTTVDKILAGNYRSRPKRVTLDALAALSGYSIEQVYRAANEPLPQARFVEQIPDDADLLSPEQREAVLAVVRQFASLNRALIRDDAEGSDGDGNAAPTKHAGDARGETQDYYDLAASQVTSDDTDEDARRAMHPGEDHP